MKTNHKLALAVLPSISIDAADGRTIHAQQVKRGPVYLISEANAITDLTAIKKYGEKVPETLTPFDGHYHFIVGGGKAEGPHVTCRGHRTQMTKPSVNVNFALRPAF
jgi:hypothetical protein